MDALTDLARTLDASTFRTGANYLLREVPGFVPILQTIHLLSVAAVMGTIVVVNLRVLGVFLPSHGVRELARRLMPWMWAALPLLLVTGVVQVFGRPMRYLVNPVFGLKFAMMVPAVALAAVFQWASSRDETFWEQSGTRRLAARVVAGCSLGLWVGVVMAGRWIAYADYLFPPE